jgi:hypothetical protein
VAAGATVAGGPGRVVAGAGALVALGVGLATLEPGPTGYMPGGSPPEPERAVGRFVSGAAGSRSESGVDASGGSSVLGST